MSEKLKPCPFCGGEIITLGIDEGLFNWAYVMTCVNCKAQGAPAEFEEGKDDTGARIQAAKAWNERAEESNERN